MAFTQDQIDSLERAIAEGVTKVKYSDKEVEYRSLDEMIKTLRMMKESVNPGSRVSITGVKIVYSTDKGY